MHQRSDQRSAGPTNLTPLLRAGEKHGHGPPTMVLTTPVYRPSEDQKQKLLLTLPIHGPDSRHVADSPLSRASSFVVHGKESSGNDPFVSPTKQPGSPEPASGDHDDSSDSSKNSPVTLASTASGVAKLLQHATAVGSPPTAPSGSGPGRQGQVAISAENAQALLPPSACVFVAK